MFIIFFSSEEKNTSRKSIDLTQPGRSPGFPSPIFQLFWLFYALKPTSPSGMLRNLSPEKGVQEQYARNLERQRALHPNTDGDVMSRQYAAERSHGHPLNVSPTQQLQLHSSTDPSHQHGDGRLCIKTGQCDNVRHSRGEGGRHHEPRI